MKGLTLTTKEQTRLGIMNGVLERHWSVSEAAQLLGVSERHAWRLMAAYRVEGAAALAHGNRDRSPSNATEPEVRAQVIVLASGRYQGVNHSHFTELLAEREGIVLSRSTVRRVLLSAGLPSPKHRQPPRHRHRRARMPQEGMLIQIDGSHHRWLGEGRPLLTLLLAVDDATGTVPYALFRDQEDTEGYFHLMKGILEWHGIPLAVYSDRYFVFCYSRRGKDPGEPSVIEKDKPTQFGRAMKELGITQIFARSPEAKGRVERANSTFQDRLVAELRLAGATNIDEANSVLATFLSRFNERFGVPASQPETSYRSLEQDMDMAAVLCFKERRRVAKDNTVQYHGRTLQIYPGTDRRSYARAHVEVQERLDGRTLVSYRGKILTPQDAPPLADFLRAQAAISSQGGLAALVPCAEPEDLPQETLPGDTQRRVIWYEDSEMKRIHRELVRTGMKKARQEGKRIGRPRVTERPEFTERFASVMEGVHVGTMSRRQAALALGVGYATLKRLLDAGYQPIGECDQRTITG